jgi:replication factor A1
MLFQDRAMQLIGKSAEKLLTKYRKSDTPPEISTLIGHKFTFIVRVLSEKKLIAHDPTFEVLSIKKNFGKQFDMPNVKIEKHSESTTTSAYQEHNLPPLVPIPKPWQNKVFFSCFLIYLASTYST